jgi:glutathione S-transferase
MRPWVALKSTGVPFEEQVIGLDLPDSAEKIRRVSSAGRVPVLLDGALTIWDSLAICEYLSETLPAAGLWPKDPSARAVARSACAEMHSSFSALRNDLPMRIYPPSQRVPSCTPGEAAQKDIARITALFEELRGRFGQEGPYLFGRFSIADAFYAPVAVGRFRSYGVPVSGVAKDYCEALVEHPAVAAWVSDAHHETLRAPLHE